MIANNQDREAFNEADIRYHEAVLQSVHNPVLQQLSIAISSLQRAVFERTSMGDEANMPQTLQNIRRCSMQYGIRTAMRQSRRRLP